MIEEPGNKALAQGPNNATGEHPTKSSFVQRWLVRFHEFYQTTYLKDHANPWNRWVHFLSNVLAIVFLTAGLIYSSRTLFLLGVWFQLGPPYLGHILFEGSHRSIDGSWIMSAVGSWYTTLQIFTGKQSITHGVRRPLAETVAFVATEEEAAQQTKPVDHG